MLLTENLSESIHCSGLNGNDGQSINVPTASTTTVTEDDDAETHDGEASLTSCIVNLLNTLVGTGMLGLPAAFAGSGFVGGYCMLALSAFFSASGLFLLSISAETAVLRKSRRNDHSNPTLMIVSERTKITTSFYSVASEALPGLTLLIDLAVSLKCFGVATGYFITFGDCMVESLRFFFVSTDVESSLHQIFLSRQFWICSAFLLVLPISFFKTLNALKYTSILSLIMVLLLAIGIILFAEDVLDPCPSTDKNDYANNKQSTPLSDSCHGNTEYFTSSVQLLQGFPIFVFAFTCHQNIFAVCNEISHRSQARINIVIVTTMLLALLLYFVVAGEGYKTFGDHVESDILLNYPQTPVVTAMRMSIALMVALSYPLQLDPSRRCFISFLEEIHRLWQRHGIFSTIETAHLDSNEDIGEYAQLPMEDQVQNAVELEDNSTENETNLVSTEISDHPTQRDDKNHRNFLFFGVTIIFLTGTFVIAMLVSDLGVVLGVVGATGSTVVSYILPGAIYIQLHPTFDRLKVLAYIQLLLGIIIVPVSLYLIL